MQAPVALLSSPALFRCCSRALARPVSVSVFSRPEAQTAQHSSCWLCHSSCWLPATPLLFALPAGHNPGNSGLRFARFLLAAAFPHCASFLLFLPTRRNPSLKQQLFSYAILGFALSEAMGLFCLMVAFLILFAM
ncbi:PREDICTED: ATP synthase F(0) complex subunit C1, mitochondrial [Lepidothrix coronata]|uniref:ATP synthase lipid-binding protein n=1 Tax=Lepidothrix coronata TaxID=321398 RepID=A0A6J0J357_9PASS|nr:PREDICTED: ATP synthase F(0) complex subunit C1, mitochondrial [Lepidothrix coronata]